MNLDALIGTRSSTDKFAVSDELVTLEVCAVARSRVCVLNRVLMLALLSRGIRADIMWRKYQDYIAALELLPLGGPYAIKVWNN